MDIVSALAILSPVPGEMHDQSLFFAGSLHPVTIPLQSLSQKQRRHLLRHGSSSDQEAALSLALKSGDEMLSWELYNRLSLEHVLSASVDLQIRSWVAGQLKAMDMPADGSHIRIKAERAQLQQLKRRMQHIESSVRHMLSSLPWPLWSGPLLIVAADEDAIVERPVLPILRISAASWNEAGVSAALCRLALQRYQQGGQELPIWLLSGLSQVAAAKTSGTGPSPRRMLRRRQRAGKEAIQAMWQGQQDFDAELAMAVCAPLAHTRHRHRLGSLIALLNHDVAVERALIIAYQRDLDSLLKKP